MVARAALDLDDAGYGPGLAIHARDATHRDVLAAVAMLTGHRENIDRFALVEHWRRQTSGESGRS